MPAVQTAATGHPGYNETMDAVPESVEKARQLTRQAMLVWGLANQAETAALLISELATNAITHTPCRTIRVIVSRPSPTRVRLAVVDKAPDQLPIPHAVNAEAESGRGLHLLKAFADCWSYDLLGATARRGPTEKSCWAELTVRTVP
jgi:anti-sigma regulatory factor (Ser/Thr protein kinase)